MMTVGGDTFISHLMEKAGFNNLYSHAKRYPEISLEDLLEKDCRLLLLSSEPYPFSEKHVAIFQSMLPAVKILLVDGEMFSWYGSRLLESPDYFHKLRVEAGLA
jgi:ABC-type Fe3+-hydroxamate transport system substrate-binding protein